MSLSSPIMILNVVLSFFAVSFYFFFGGLVMYLRKDIFDDKNYYDEVNEFWGEGLIWDGARSIRYVDIVINFYAVYYIFIQAISFYLCANIFNYIFYTLCALLPSFIGATLLLFLDKVNWLFLKLGGDDIRSDEGFKNAYYFYIGLPIFLYILVIALYVMYG